MPHGTKIATCCYCGTRAALVLRGENRHELSCSACGAPLHDMKMLRADHVTQSEGPASGKLAKPKSRQKVATPLPVWERKLNDGKRKKKKKRKTFAKKLFEEAFDVLEDIFD